MINSTLLSRQSRYEFVSLEDHCAGRDCILGETFKKDEITKKTNKQKANRIGSKLKNDKRKGNKNQERK